MMSRWAHPPFTLLTLLPAVLLWLAPGAHAQQGSVATDKAALVALYNATDGPNWKTSTNWLSEAPLSTWHGVLLTTPSGRVRILSLHANRLHGPIPAEIANLTELELLNLTNNDLEGVLPTGLMNLTRLDTLWTGQVDLCAPRDPAFEAWLETIDFGGMLCPPQEQSVIDVAVFYTPAARDFAGGGAAEIESLIDSMVAETNLAYAASGVNQRLSLVEAQEVAHTEANAPTDQERLVDKSDGVLDGVHAIRDEVAADVVMLLGDYDRGFADVMSFVSPGFEDSALGVASVTDVRWFAHELGHIMGLRHDRHLECHEGHCSRSSFEDAYGYVNQEAFEAGAPDSAGWYTIMAYGAQCVANGLDCEPVLRFSNPDRLWPPGDGEAMGIPGVEHTGAVRGPANAARALNRTRATVANFRTPTAVTVSFGATVYTAAEGGEAATVTVNLSSAPGRPVSVPLVSMGATGATASDYTAPGSVAFAATETAQTFTVTAVDDDADDDGETVTLAFDTRVLPSGMTVGNPATATVTLDDDDRVAGAPSVSTVALTSDPGPDAIYALGDEIEATVRFDKNVTVTGTPQLALTVGDEDRTADYDSVTDAETLFLYKVVTGDVDTNGVSIAVDSLSLNGGQIKDGSDNQANLEHRALGNQSRHRVDGIKPKLASTGGAVVNGSTLTLTYNETLDSSSTPPASAFFVFGGASSLTISGVGVRGSVVELRLNPAVEHGETGIQVTYTVPVEVGATPIQDRAGNEAEGLSGEAVTNVTPETTTPIGPGLPPVPNPVPSAPRNLEAVGGDEQVTLSWEAPEDDGGFAITDYEYLISGTGGGWISTGSTETTHTVTELTNGRLYVFQVRAVSAAGAGNSSHRVEVTPGVGRLEFAHFANGSSITSDLVLVNVFARPIRPWLYFYDREGERIAVESVVELTEELEVAEDGSLTVQSEMQPLETLTISTHGQGEVVVGSVTVLSNGPLGGVLRFDLPGVGVAGVGAGQPLRDALFPARRQAGGISTAAAIRNLEAEELVVSCQLMQEGAVLEEVDIELKVNGQDGRFIEEVFTTTDTSNFSGLVRCRAEGEFTGVAVELDAGQGIFTTLPVLPVDRTVFRGEEYTLGFAHFANGASITSDLVLVNVSIRPSRPAGPYTTPIPPTRPSFYFYDRAGERLAAQSVVEVAGDLEVTEDGSLSVQTEMQPLQAVTISTHGRGEVVAGSVTVVSNGPLGGVLRFDLPGVGVAGVGTGQPLTDALFPARRQEGGISTAAAIRNLEAEELVVSCRLMQEGIVLEEEEITLEINGQDGRFIEEVFTRTDTSDFVGLVRCTAEGEFAGVAVELDAANRIFTTLPVVPVQAMTSQD